MFFLIRRFKYAGGDGNALPGGSSVSMSEILSMLGLSGKPAEVSVSDARLFSAESESGEWIVIACGPFDTMEWMKVVLNGVTYEIAVTDAQSVSYIQRSWNGSTVMRSTETASATPVTSSSTTWGTAGGTSWYVVNSNVTISNRVTANGTVNLILCDGCTLTASKGITVTGNNTLNIYGQSGDTGALIAKQNTSSSAAGIGGSSENDCGTVNIYGGTVTATGGI